MAEPIFLDGQQLNFHPSDKPRKLITSLGLFCSVLLIVNKQPPKPSISNEDSGVAPAMRLTTVGSERICIDSKQQSYRLSKKAYLSGGHQIEGIHQESQLSGPGSPGTLQRLRRLM
jgi:hypothetical protein